VANQLAGHIDLIDRCGRFGYSLSIGRSDWFDRPVGRTWVGPTGRSDDRSHVPCKRPVRRMISRWEIAWRLGLCWGRRVVDRVPAVIRWGIAVTPWELRTIRPCWPWFGTARCEKVASSRESPRGQRTLLSWFFECSSFVGFTTYYTPPLIGGGIKRCFCLTSVCLSDVCLSRTSGVTREQIGLEDLGSRWWRRAI